MLSCELHTELNTNKCNEEEEAMVPNDDDTLNLLQTLENQTPKLFLVSFAPNKNKKWFQRH